MTWQAVQFCCGTSAQRIGCMLGGKHSRYVSVSCLIGLFVWFVAGAASQSRFLLLTTGIAPGLAFGVAVRVRRRGCPNARYGGVSNRRVDRAGLARCLTSYCISHHAVHPSPPNHSSSLLPSTSSLQVFAIVAALVNVQPCLRPVSS